MTQAIPDHPAREESFLALFGSIESLLETRLRLVPGHNNKLSQLISRYIKTNSYWGDQGRDLDHLRNVRNVLTHDRDEGRGFSIRVTEQWHQRLEEIHAGLRNPVPISTRHRRGVTSVLPDHSLAHAIRWAYEMQFSQFPVIDEAGRFRGVVTENEVTRWLGRHVTSRGSTVDLAGVVVSAVLEEEEPDRRGIPIFRFGSLDAPETEVLGLFMTYPMLEVILLTTTGNSREAIEGIVTHWDAARYPPG